MQSLVESRSTLSAAGFRIFGFLSRCSLIRITSNQNNQRGANRHEKFELFLN